MAASHHQLRVSEAAPLSHGPSCCNHRIPSVRAPHRPRPCSPLLPPLPCPFGITGRAGSSRAAVPGGDTRPPATTCPPSPSPSPSPLPSLRLRGGGRAEGSARRPLCEGLRPPFVPPARAPRDPPSPGPPPAPPNSSPPPCGGSKRPGPPWAPSRPVPPRRLCARLGAAPRPPCARPRARRWSRSLAQETSASVSRPLPGGAGRLRGAWKPVGGRAGSGGRHKWTGGGGGGGARRRWRREGGTEGGRERGREGGGRCLPGRAAAAAAAAAATGAAAAAERVAAGAAPSLPAAPFMSRSSGPGGAARRRRRREPGSD